jgi:hypothetical protein
MDSPISHLRAACSVMGAPECIRLNSLASLAEVHGSISACPKASANRWLNAARSCSVVIPMPQG